MIDDDFFKHLKEIGDTKSYPEANQTADEHLCHYTAQKMKERLAEKRGDKGGWWDEDVCSAESLRVYLKDLIDKNANMIDIINLSAMIMALEEKNKK